MNSPIAIAKYFYSNKQQREHAVRSRILRSVKKRRKFFLEPLEPRLLLDAAPIVFAGAETALNLTVSVVQDQSGAQLIQLLDNNATPGANVVASQALAETSGVVINGSDQNDSLTIDRSAASIIPIAFNGGAGNDTVYGPSGDTTWYVTGDGAGHVGAVEFTGIENLTGASDSEDTFVFEASGSLSGVVDGGAGGFDSLVVNGTFDTIVFTPSGPDSGTVDRDGDVLTYAGLEPVNAGDATNVIFNGTAGVDDWVVEDSLTAGQIQVRSTSGAIETTSFGSPMTVTINLGSGNDTFVIESLGDSGFTGAVTVNGGADNDTITVHATTGGGTFTLAGGLGDDTFKLDDNWGAVRIVEAVSEGNDTLDFSDFGGGAITITPGITELTIADAATGTNTVTIANANVANFESLVGANIDLTGSLASVKAELVDGLKKIVTFVRNLAASGNFLTDLPVIGGTADVTIGKALDFAEALDEIRFQIEEYFENPALLSLTSQDLIDFLENKFLATSAGYIGALKHFGAAIFANKPLADSNIVAADVYDFKLTVDGTVYHVVVDVDAEDPPGTPKPPTVAGNTVTVGLGTNAAAYTVENLLDNINLAIAELSAISGQLGAAERNGRLAFQVLSTEIDEFKLAAGNALDAAAMKLGLSTADIVLANVQDILKGLGDLDVSLATGVALAVSFEGGTPKLRFGLDYRGERTSEFFYNFGPEAQSLGLAFDVQAKIMAMAQLVADVQLGLGLTDATTADFFLDVDALRAGVSLTAAAVSDVELNLGFLGLEANGSLELEAGLTVNNATLATLKNVADPSAINVNAFGLTTTGGDGTGSPSFDINLTLSVDVGTADIGFAATGSLTASGDPFNGSSIDLLTDASFDSNFPSFNNLNSAGVISLLGQLGSWLDGVRQSDVIKSLNIPFVAGGLEKILDLAEVLGDALLFDEGPDDVKDGSDKLATDLNEVLGDARLDRLIRAQGDASSIDFVAADPLVTFFSISAGPGDAGGFAQLGLVAGNATIVGGTLTKQGNAGPLLGRITSKAVIHFSVTRDGKPTMADVVLEPPKTAVNLGLGDDKPKLLDAANAPTFSNTQEMTDRLIQVLADFLPAGIQYNPATKVLTVDIDFDDIKLFSVELPTDFELDLGSIINVQSNTRLIIDATGGLNLTLGFDLGPNPSGAGTLTDADTLAADADRLTVDVKLEEAITFADTPRAIVGNLTGDANFSITFNPTVPVVVPQFAGDDETDIDITDFGISVGTNAEIAMAVNPTDPDNIIIAPIVDEAPPDKVFVSFDGGQNWGQFNIPTVNPADEGVGDPTIVFDRTGRAVYAHLVDAAGADDSHLEAAVSTDGGLTWTASLITVGSQAVNDDKEMLAVGPDVAEPSRDLFVVSWVEDSTVYAAVSRSISGEIAALSVSGGGVGNPPAGSVIITSGAPHGLEPLATIRIQDVQGATQINDRTFEVILIDDTHFYLVPEAGAGLGVYTGGGTWSTAGVDWSRRVQVGAEPFGAVGDSINPIPAVGPDGQIYIAWEDTPLPGQSLVRFATSTDGGLTFSRDRTILFPTSGSSDLTASSSRFDIEFSDRFDSNGFLADPARRAVLEAAASYWEKMIGDDFATLSSGSPIRMPHPTTGAIFDFTTQSTIDDLRIYVGQANLAGAAAESIAAFAQNAEQTARNTAAKFEPWVGSLTFSSATPFYVDPTPLNPTDDVAPLAASGKPDLLSVAIHEIGHILGFHDSTPAFAADISEQVLAQGTATSAIATTLTDSGAAFTTAGTGLAGRRVRITGGTGADQVRIITSNTATSLTVSAAFNPALDATSQYRVVEESSAGPAATAALPAGAKAVLTFKTGIAHMDGNTQGDLTGVAGVKSVMVPTFTSGVRVLPQDLDIAILRDMGYDPPSVKVLDDFAAFLTANPSFNVEVGGHTDSDGSAASNLVLAQARAQAVVNYLVGKGIDASRLRIVAYGEVAPIADNSIESLKALNRRVELSVERTTVLFDPSGSFALSTAATDILDQYVTFLNANPSLKVELIGHTDSDGEDDPNITLSYKRAKAVADYLILQGIAANRLRLNWEGEDMPVASNATAAGKAFNRRVDLRIDNAIYVGNLNYGDDYGLITNATQTDPVVITTSAPHGLATGASVSIAEVAGMPDLNGFTYTITVLTDTTFRLNGEDGTGYPPYLAGGTWLAEGDISGATRANPVVITTATAHGLTTGEVIAIEDVEGMTELNDDNFVVTVLTPTTFSLDNTDGTGFTAYTGEGTWELATDYTIPAQPARGIIMGVSMDVDRSDGPNRGNIYISFADQADLDGTNDRGLRKSPATIAEEDHDDTEIFLLLSSDGGGTWNSSALVKVNDDVGTASQFHPILDLDQSTGHVAVAWYDARNDDGALGSGDTNSIANDEVQFFASFSTDGGATWADNIQVSDGTSDAQRGDRLFNFGEYNGLSFVNGTIHMSWANNSAMGTIDDATNDNPVQITTSAPHGLRTGQVVQIDGVVGMTELNGRQFTITSTGDDTFTLNGEDGTGHGAYLTGGDWVLRGADVFYDRIRLANESIADLLGDINAALAQAGLGTKFQAQSGSNLVKLVAIDPTITEFTVSVASSADPAFRDLGFQTTAESGDDAGVPTVRGAKDVPTLVGQLTADASFDLTLDGVTKTITIQREDTVSAFGSNRNILDLVNDVQKAIDNSTSGFGPNKIKVSSTGGKLLFTRLGPVTAGNGDAFTVTPGANAGELGLTSAITSDEADLLIVTRNGAMYRVTLDAAATIGDVISTINSLPGNPVTISKTVDDPNGEPTPINEANTGLTIIDNTAGTASFAVMAANGSLAGVRLGILGFDDNPVNPDDVPDGKIVGSTIAGATLLDRFFIEGENLNALKKVINAKVQVQAGLVVENIKVEENIAGPKSKISSSSFEFLPAHVGMKLVIKDVAGFTPGTYTIEAVASNIATLSGKVGEVDVPLDQHQQGGVGVLQSGVQASANFGFVGISLDGAASLGAELALGFNTNAAAVADNHLTLRELVDAIQQGNALNLLAPPDLTPIAVAGTTTAAGTATTLTDANQRFADAKRVKAGDVIRNLTDGSMATVASIDSNTTLTTAALNGGTDNTWDMADEYEIEIRNLGAVDLSLGLAAGSVDFSGLASTLLGADPRVVITLVTLGDPFIDTRFDQASYNQTSATTFEVNGDFRSKLPNGVTLRFTETATDESHDVTVAMTSFADGKTTVTVTPDAENPFNLPDESIFDDFSVTLLPKLDIQTPDLGDLPDLSDLSFADIIAMLRQLATFLGQFEAFDFLSTDLPIINRSVNDLLAFADQFAMALDEAQSNPAGTLQVLENKINEAIGISSVALNELAEALGQGQITGATNASPIVIATAAAHGLSNGGRVTIAGVEGNTAANGTFIVTVVDATHFSLKNLDGTNAAGNGAYTSGGTWSADDAFDLTYDTANDLLKIDFVVGTGFSKGLDMAIPRINFGNALNALGLGSVFDLSGSAGLKAAGGVMLRLSLAFDVANLTPGDLLDPAQLLNRLYVVDTTGLLARLVVGGDDIAFRLGLGPFALSIADGEITIAGEARAGLDSSIFNGGKVLLSDINLGADFDPSLTGTITGNLPAYFPNDSTSAGAIRIGGSSAGGAFTVAGNLLNLLDNPLPIIHSDPDVDISMPGSLDANRLVLDVSSVVDAISNFNFDSFNLFDNIFLAIDGLDLALGFVQDVVGDKIGGLTIPLIGDGLDKAAHFIGDLREDVIAPLRSGIEKAKDAAQDFADPDKNIISKLLFDLLGPSGADLLQDRNWDGTNDGSVGDFIDLNTNLDDFLFNPNTTLELKDVFIEWDLSLSDTLVNESADIGFDLGIPGLGLSTEGDINLNVEWLLNLGFGLSFMEGFYLKIDDPHELLFDVSVDLSADAAITGTLGFLGLRAFDKEIEGNRTKLGATFMVDVFQDDGTGNPVGGVDGRKLAFTEFGKIGFEAGIAAEAAASLGFEVGLSAELLAEIFGPGATDVVAGFPKLIGDFVFLWEIGNRGSGATLNDLANNSTFVSFANIGDAVEVGLKKVAFQDVGVDLGSFLSDVLGPIVEEVGKFTEPLQPIIDFITSPVPIIGQLGLSITWLDVAAAFGGFDPSFIEAVAEIITLVNKINSLGEGGSVVLEIGDFTAFNQTGVGEQFLVPLWDAGNDPSATFDYIKQNVPGLINDLIGDGLIGDALGALAGAAADVLADVVEEESAGGFKFPFFEQPSSLFGLLMGKPVDLVTYDMAPLEFEFEFRAFFSILGPLGVSIGLIAEASLDTAFGYDTLGIEKFVKSGFRNPGLLFDGFFISDSPKLNGVDEEELRFFAELQAAAELNLGIARAGVAAALGFEILFDLFDPNEDGKVRFTELVGNITNQLCAPGAEKLLAPLAIFDVTGEIFARFFAFLEIDFGFFTFEKEFPIYGPVTLLDFEIDFFRPPILASEQGNGDLVVHTGEFAEQRELGNATDVSEYLIIQSDGTDGDYVVVKIKSGDGALGPDADTFNDCNTYKVRKGGRIIIDGGEGDDRYDLTGFVEIGVLFEIDLGVGNDVVMWGAGGGVPGQFNMIHGGSGDDQIDGSNGSDLIFGQAGNDTINSAGGDDLVFGDDGEIADSTARGLIKPTDGRDTIDLGSGRDIGFGGGEKDLIKGGTGADADLLIGGGGLAMFNGPKVFGNVLPLVQGGVTETENLTFDSTAGDTIEGGDGADLLFGTAGPDLIKGEGGADKIFGLSGFDTIDAGGGDDIVFGDNGKIVPDTVNDVDSDPDLVPIAGGAADEIQGGTGNDIIFGGDGGDFIQGGDDHDTIFGGSGADKIFGDNGHIAADGSLMPDSGSGNDLIFGEGEADKIQGGAGNDNIDGGLGNDIIRGGAGSDLITTNKSSDDLDGQGGDDTYLIFFQGGNAVALTRVNDTGPDGEVDLFVATGTVFDDKILLRANTDGSVSFVALINSVFAVERINYNFTIERIVINGSFGDDYFASDDTVAEVTINGEFGDDVFQIGQMFKSDRGDQTDVNPFDNFSDVTGIGVGDIFATIETTRGFLSNGISAPMTINGGVGNDLFTVFHNKAVLQLNGEEGDDTFEIRAFALAGSQEPQRERTDISGGAGADLVQYAVNAPVNIDGGDGFDTVIIIGTEFGDDLVITEKGVFGAGLNVNFVNIESLRVDGAEGDDRFFVKSTSEKFLTEIFGGLGDDTFNMSGDTPPVVSNDLKGHSGLILHDVESNDPKFDEQKIFGISANVADNEEPFAVIRPTGGSTIITEGSGFDSYQIVLTRKPDKDVLILVLAPIPTPDSRERRALSFRVSSPAAGSVVTNNGTGLTLRFTSANWYVPQEVRVSADTTVLTDTSGLFTRPELGDGTIPPGVSFDMDDDAFEGVRFGVINHLVKTGATTLSGNLVAVNNATPSVNITDPGTPGLTTALLGRKLFITEGPGAGDSRFILGVVDNGSTLTLTLDRPFLTGNVPTTNSKFFVRIDDAIIGKMSSFNESPSGLPAVTTPEDKRSTFTDSSASFPTAGQGLTGAILEIIGGPGAGQQRLILGNLGSDPTHTLILNGPWRINPVAGQSIYRIVRYEGLSLPSVSVQINDNDRPGLIVDETMGIKNTGAAAIEASDIVADYDTITAVIEGGNGDQLGEWDVIRVQLSRDPGATPVTVNLIYGSQLQVTDLSGALLTSLSFNSGNWNTPQNLLVKAVDDSLREGFHSGLIEFVVGAGSADTTASKTDAFLTIPGDRPVFYVGLSFTPVAASVAVTLNATLLTQADQFGKNGDYIVISNKIVFVDHAGDLKTISGNLSVSYNYTVAGFLSAFTFPVLTRINDDSDAPTVVVRETGGSTDVIEVKKGGSDPESIPVAQNTDQSPWTDSYELVLTGNPTDNVIVTVTPAITKTTRTGGIRHDAIQVEISSTDGRAAPDGNGNLIVTFSNADWDDPVVIMVKAKDDAVVDGSDTQVFAPGPNTLSGILGPVIVEGAGGRGSLAINAPLMLPGEINRRESDGNVVAFAPNPSSAPGVLEQMTVETADLSAKLTELGFGSTAFDKLIDRTVEMSFGQGVDVVLDPARPNEKFDRFWMITAVENVTGHPEHKLLTLQNPSQLNVASLALTDIPNSSSEYAITALSANFFVDEKTQVDFMFVHDEDSPADSTGVLTSTRLSGLNMGPDLVIGGQLRPGGITYNDLEVIEVNLGKGNNNFTVLGTHTREDGYQTWTFLNSGDEPVPYMGVQGDTVTVKLNAIDIVTATGTTSAAANPSVGNGFKTTVTVPGSFANDSLAGQLIRIINDGLGENNHEADGQVRRILGNTGGLLRVDRQWEFLPDNEAFEIINEADGAFAVNLQGGNDTLDASASTLGIVAFGGLGSDMMIGGSGDDIIFGDRGRVDYFNKIGAIVTRLGDAPEPITGFVTKQVAVSPGPGEDPLNMLTDSGASFPVPDDLADGLGTDDIGLRGLYFDINNGFGFLQPIRLTENNTATTLTLAEPFDDELQLPGPVPGDESEYRISTIPENQTDGVVRSPNLLITVDNDLVDPILGAEDIINAGGGKDQIFGGAAGDNISAGAGDDVVIGDAGRIDRTVDPNGPTEPGIGDVVSSFFDLIRTIDFAQGDDDNINGDAGNDILIGGTEDDNMEGGADLDILLGDQGTADFQEGTLVAVEDPGTDGDDFLTGGDDPDLIIGGLGNDAISGLGAADILIGDAAEVLYAADGTTIISIESVDRDNIKNGMDTIYGGSDDDIIIGGSNADRLDGGDQHDLIFGDNVMLVRNAGSGNAIDPRFRALTGTTIYGLDGSALVDLSFDAAPPTERPAWADWTITLDQTLAASHFGDDNIAGGAHNDEIFGQLGNDTIQGDGSIGPITGVIPVNFIMPSMNFSLAAGGMLTLASPTNYGADRSGGVLSVTASFEGLNDGDDYIEGNAGNDVIFGNLGQDDIIGGSSSLFSLTTAGLRPDGSNLIFGGAGTDIARNNLGDDTAANGHARDADMILGGNGNILRLVGVTVNGSVILAPASGASVIGGVATFNGYLALNYDNYNTLKIIPRAVHLLDYTPGGPDFNATGAATDIGAADEIHGEAGDDFIYGQVGNDVLFGDGQNDVIIGGYGADWISGGTGDDGILGDDGRIFVSRNSTSFGEPLYGIAAIPAANINQLIVTSDGVNNAIINVNLALKYTVDLTPDHLDPSATPNVLFRPLYANDVIYGGLGNDSIHGGAGNDAISGAEAPVLSYTNNYDQNGSKVLTDVESDFSHPFNPGNVLGYNPTTTKFALYDANDPLRKILLTASGALWKGMGTSFNWLLNFDQTEGPVDTFWIQGQNEYPGVPTDGDDHIFGDLGNDWMVGGTGRDTLYGGWGDDVLNADDNLNTNGGLNNGFDTTSSDTNPSYEDLAFGGAGRDVLIGNTNGDRLMDWVGEFNTFLVPYAQFGVVSVSRLLRPSEPQYLYDLSKSDGADQTLAAQYGSDPARNGEPFGELGLVLQQDAAWQAQTGGPRDPQAGNIGGGKVDVKNNPGTAGTKPIYETAEGSAPTAGTVDLLTDSQLAPIVAEAKALWTQALGADDTRLGALDHIQVEVGNLPDERLGVTLGNRIFVDSNAAGYGWFVDNTPYENSEYRMNGGLVVASGNSDAYGRMDLLTAVMHEIGHVLGYEHGADELMGATLAAGERRLEGERTEIERTVPFGIAERTTANAMSERAPLIDWERSSVELSTPMEWSNGWAKRSGGVNFPEFVYAGFDNNDGEQSVFGPKKKRLEDIDAMTFEPQGQIEWRIEIG